MTATHTAYSPLKIFHHPSRLAALGRGEHHAPLHVQLIPTNKCNQNCDGCAYRMEGYPSNAMFDTCDEIPWSKLVEVIDDCEDMGVRAIELTGGGEPTLHPQFLELCQRIVDAGIDLGVVTNGVRWSSRFPEILACAKWVRFSIDAGCEETYSSYRHTTPRGYEVVRSNLRSLVVAKTSPEMLIGVGFVVTKENWKEVKEATRRAREDGADNIRISALFQNQGAEYFHAFYDDASELCREAELLSTPSFRVFNLFGDRLHDLHDAAPDYRECGYSKLTTYLGADQTAYTCCMNAYNEKGIIGTFREQSFRDMWFSEKTRQRLQGRDARQCPRCMYNAKNTTIAYATDPKPLHVSFV